MFCLQHSSLKFPRRGDFLCGTYILNLKNFNFGFDLNLGLDMNYDPWIFKAYSSEYVCSSVHVHQIL